MRESEREESGDSVGAMVIGQAVRLKSQKGQERRREKELRSGSASTCTVSSRGRPGVEPSRTSTGSRKINGQHGGRRDRGSE